MKKIAFTFLFFCFILTLQAAVYKSVIGCTAGNLSSSLTSTEKSTVTNLTVTGILDARDFKTMRDSMPVLAVIDIGSDSIAYYTGPDGTLSSPSSTYPVNELPWCAFYNSSSGLSKTTLTAVTLPAKITSIGRNTFNNCHGISTLSIPATVTTIQNWAFTDCGNNLAITIPAAVTSIQNWAFEAFNGPITVHASNPNYSSDNGVLFNKDKTTLIQCPASKSGNYIIPSTVTLIGMNSFSRCSLLKGAMVIPPTVTVIGGWAFRQCTGLTGPLTIPESVDSIGDGAFYMCSGLTNIYSYQKIPVDISHSSGVFSQINTTLCSLVIPDGTTSRYAAADQWKDFTISEKPYPGTIPFSEDFSSGILPYGWSVDDHIGIGQIWEFGVIPSTPILPVLTGNYAYLNSDTYGNGNTQNTDLISPVFDFSKYTHVVLSFDHYFRYNAPSTAQLFYSRNNGVDWIMIQDWPGGTTNPANFSLDLTSAVAGYSHVIFKWNYTGTWAWLWAIDNISVTADYITNPVLKLRNSTISGDETLCYDATDTIYVADNGLPVDLLSGSSVNLIAGKCIRIIPGFHAYSGSDFSAWITETGDFCNTVSPSIVENPIIEKSALLDNEFESINQNLKEKSVKVYPNPNNGQFTLEFSNVESGAIVNIYNILGAIVYQSAAKNEVSQKISLPNIERGIYFVKIMAGKKHFTKKMIVN
jgi:hypothetical protein